MELFVIQGFSVDGQENIQEILSKRLYLCQFLAALMVLRPGGSRSAQANYLCSVLLVIRDIKFYIVRYVHV